MIITSVFLGGFMFKLLIILSFLFFATPACVTLDAEITADCDAQDYNFANKMKELRYEVGDLQVTPDNKHFRRIAVRLDNNAFLTTVIQYLLLKEDKKTNDLVIKNKRVKYYNDCKLSDGDVYSVYLEVIKVKASENAER